MARCRHCEMPEGLHVGVCLECPVANAVTSFQQLFAIDKNGRRVEQGDAIWIDGLWQKIEKLDGVMADGTFAPRPGDRGSRGFRRDVRECMTGTGKGMATLSMTEAGSTGPVWLEAVCSCGANETKGGVLFDGKFVPHVPPELLDGSFLLTAVRAWNVARGAPDAEERERPVFFEVDCEAFKKLEEERQRKLVAETVRCDRCEGSFRASEVVKHLGRCSGSAHIERTVELLEREMRRLDNEDDALSISYMTAIDILRMEGPARRKQVDEHMAWFKEILSKKDKNVAIAIGKTDTEVSLKIADRETWLTPSAARSMSSSLRDMADLLEKRPYCAHDTSPLADWASQKANERIIKGAPEERLRMEVAEMRDTGLHVVVRRWDGKAWTADPEDERAEAAWRGAPPGSIYLAKGGWVPHADTDRKPIVLVTGTEEEALDKNGRKVVPGDEMLLGRNSPGWHKIENTFQRPGGFWQAYAPTAGDGSCEPWWIVSSYETRPFASEPLDKNGRKVSPGDEIGIMGGWYKVDSLERDGAGWCGYVGVSSAGPALWPLSSRPSRPAKDIIDRAFEEVDQAAIRELLERELEAARFALASAYDTCASECDAQADALVERAGGIAIGPMVEGILEGVKASRDTARHFRAKSFREGDAERRGKILDHAEERGFRIAIRLVRKAVTERPRREDADLLDAINSLTWPSRS